jgi:hypothetical protein
MLGRDARMRGLIVYRLPLGLELHSAPAHPLSHGGIQEDLASGVGEDGRGGVPPLQHDAADLADALLELHQVPPHCGVSGDFGCGSRDSRGAEVFRDVLVPEVCPCPTTGGARLADIRTLSTPHCERSDAEAGGGERGRDYQGDDATT